MPTTAFQAAAAYLSSAPSLAKVPNATKLEVTNSSAQLSLLVVMTPDESPLFAFSMDNRTARNKYAMFRYMHYSNL